MNNTTVTIQYSNGDTREFIASDDLELLIMKGEMFSISTLHPDKGDETKLSKMYVGNPMVVLGYMITMLHNAQELSDEENEVTKPVIINILIKCIEMLKDEIVSCQSNMSPVEGDVLIEPSWVDEHGDVSNEIYENLLTKDSK